MTLGILSGRRPEKSLDTELQQCLEKMTGRLEMGFRTEIQGSRTEIQGMHTDMQGLRTELRTEIQGLRTEMQSLRTELRSEIEQAKDESIAAAREMQTEVIRYIANIAEPFNVRMRHLEANSGNMETAERLRLAAVEERLLRIEKKVLGTDPPHSKPH